MVAKWSPKLQDRVQFFEDVQNIETINNLELKIKVE
jgi:hypothetical protein